MSSPVSPAELGSGKRWGAGVVMGAQLAERAPQDSHRVDEEGQSPTTGWVTPMTTPKYMLSRSGDGKINS